jgi:hypothetical protein
MKNHQIRSKVGYWQMLTISVLLVTQISSNASADVSGEVLVLNQVNQPTTRTCWAAALTMFADYYAIEYFDPRGNVALLSNIDCEANAPDVNIDCDYGLCEVNHLFYSEDMNLSDQEMIERETEKCGTRICTFITEYTWESCCADWVDECDTGAAPDYIEQRLRSLVTEYGFDIDYGFPAELDFGINAIKTEIHRRRPLLAYYNDEQGYLHAIVIVGYFDDDNGQFIVRANDPRGHGDNSSYTEIQWADVYDNYIQSLFLKCRYTDDPENERDLILDHIVTWNDQFHVSDKCYIEAGKDFKLDSNDTVTFEANIAIRLTDGFAAPEGSSFHASISGL